MRARRWSPLAVLALIGACSGEAPTKPRAVSEVARHAITDGAHGGNTHFYFLQPLVPAPSYSGTFDGSLSTTVTVCVVVSASCGASVATFSGADIKVDLKAEFYQATWKTKDAGLDPAKTYRIAVAVATSHGTRTLGYADLLILQNGSQLKLVDKTQYVATINGGTLQIRFRVETTAVPGSWQPV